MINQEYRETKRKNTRGIERDKEIDRERKRNMSLGVGMVASSTDHDLLIHLFLAGSRLYVTHTFKLTISYRYVGFHVILNSYRNIQYKKP